MGSYDGDISPPEPVDERAICTSMSAVSGPSCYM